MMVLLCLACKQQEQKGSTAVNPTGAYTLVSVDGKDVPCTVQHAGHSVSIHSGAFVINEDRTCSSKMDFTAPNGVKASRNVNATYRQKGDTLTMKWDRAGVTKGAVHGDTFTMNNEGMVLTYRR